MTSFAFILGVVPLVVASGAGAEMRRSLGTAVFSGMLGVTLFGIFLTPVFFYVIQGIGETRLFAGATTQWIVSCALGLLVGLAGGFLLWKLDVFGFWGAMICGVRPECCRCWPPWGSIGRSCPDGAENKGSSSVLSRFFIDWPVFAVVISVVITLAGGVAVFTLPVAQIPKSRRQPFRSRQPIRGRTRKPCATRWPPRSKNKSAVSRA